MPLDNLLKINDICILHVNVKCRVLNVKEVLEKLGLSELGKLLSIYSSRMLMLKRNVILHQAPGYHCFDEIKSTEQSY